MTDNDRELLELAAKAAGMPYHSWGCNFADMTDPASPKRWNPLTDDGDALRLAVDLDLTLYAGSGIAQGTAPTDVRVWGGINPDRRMALRVAILHAAAEIGRKL